MRPIDLTLPVRSDRIPAEIWLHIIECSSLEQEDIANLSLVGKHLRYVVQPMLFSTVRVSLIRARYLDTSTPVRCQHVRYYDRLQKRLKFATSDRIAPFVKALAIRIAGERVDIERVGAVKEGQVLQAVFDVLPCFINLRSFSAQDISLDGSHFDSLAKFEHFNGLHLERCTCTGDLGLTRLRVKYLSLHGKMHGSYGWWIPLVTCSSVEHLSYDAPLPLFSDHNEPEVLFPALAVLPRPMHSLRTLRLPAHAQHFPCFVGALSQCASVENLYIEPSPPPQIGALTPVDHSLPVLRRKILPRLKAVCASPHFVQSLIMSRDDQMDLKHISIRGQKYNPMAVLELVRERCQGVEEIVIDLPILDDMSPLDLLLTDLRALRGLFVTVNSLRLPHKEVYRRMKTSAYPPILRSLHIKFPYLKPSPASPLTRRFSHTTGQITSGKTRSTLVSRIRAQAPSVVEVEVGLAKPIVWRDPYSKPVKWYEWDDHGGRAVLL